MAALERTFLNLSGSLLIRTSKVPSHVVGHKYLAWSLLLFFICLSSSSVERSLALINRLDKKKKIWSTCLFPFTNSMPFSFLVSVLWGRPLSIDSCVIFNWLENPNFVRSLRLTPCRGSYTYWKSLSPQLQSWPLLMHTAMWVCWKATTTLKWKIPPQCIAYFPSFITKSIMQIPTETHTHGHVLIYKICMYYKHAYK